MNTVAPPDWSNVAEPTAHVIVHRATTFIDAQFRAGLAADQRAMIGASVFIGFSGAVLTAALSLWSGGAGDKPLLAAGVTIALLFLVSAGFCFHAARPVTFYFPGNQPRNWWSVATEPLGELFGYESENLEEVIEENEDVLANNADLLRKGVRLALATPVIGFCVWALFLL